MLAVRSFGSVIEETYLASIIDLPLPLNVTLHVQPIAQSEALALVKRQIDWMDKEIIDEQMSAVKKGYDYQILPPELRFSKEEAEELLDFLRNKSERLFVYTGLVYTWADSLEELDRRVQQVTSVAQGCTIGLEPLHFRQRQALNSVLPLGDNHVTVSRYLTTGQVAMQMPFASQSLDEAGGGYYGQSRESGNLVLCDRKRLASPMGFVCGKPGSGKSFSVKREITNTVLAHPEDEVVIFDPAGEYGNLVGALGGANVELAPGCSAVLNPLDTADVATAPTPPSSRTRPTRCSRSRARSWPRAARACRSATARSSPAASARRTGSARGTAACPRSATSTRRCSLSPSPRPPTSRCATSAT